MNNDTYEDIDNNSRFVKTITPDYSLNNDPEDEDLSDCNLDGFHFIVPTAIEENDMGYHIAEKKGHKFELRTN